jgi:hypothetical protein
MAARFRALALYKELHRLGRDYPDPSCVHTPRTPHYSFTHSLSGTTFMQESAACSKVSHHLSGTCRITRSSDLVENRHLTDKDEIENALKLGEYIKKGSSLRHCSDRSG